MLVRNSCAGYIYYNADQRDLGIVRALVLERIDHILFLLPIELVVFLVDRSTDFIGQVVVFVPENRVPHATTTTGR